jgi:hypothetical protein
MATLASGGLFKGIGGLTGLEKPKNKTYRHKKNPM